MKWKLARVNVASKISQTRNKRITSQDLLAEIHRIWEENDHKTKQIKQELNSGDSGDINHFDIDLLDSSRIYHLRDIEKICIEYRLRFLHSSFFKAEIPAEAISEIKKLERQHQTRLKNFKIIAPSKLLKLENADDPLLFAPMGNDYFYLIHSWGNDLHPLRKILMWPFRSLEHFVFVLLFGSLLLAFLVPDGLFSPKQSTTEFIMIFFFIFKWVAGLAIFYGVKYGKNFNSAIWQSRYYNA